MLLTFVTTPKVWVIILISQVRKQTEVKELAQSHFLGLKELFCLASGGPSPNYIY